MVEPIAAVSGPPPDSGAGELQGLLSAKRAAAFLGGLSLSWLYTSDVPFVRIGRRRLYERQALVEYAARHRVMRGPA